MQKEKPAPKHGSKSIPDNSSTEALTQSLRADFLKNYENIPPELKRIACWLLWHIGSIDAEKGKASKIPAYATTAKNRKGDQGSPDDRANLVTFDEAMKSFRKNKRFAGLGIATLPEFGITALDFDHCVNGGEIRGEVLKTVDDTYAEISPSGCGVRAFMLGTSMDGKNHADGFELFSNRGFVTVTGNQVENDYFELGMPLQRLDAPTREKLERMAESKTRDEGSKQKRADPIIEAFKQAGLYERDMGWGGKHSVTCPFEREHSDYGRPPGDGDTVILEAHYDGRERTVVHCSHSHCANRKTRDFLEAIGLDDLDGLFDTLVDAAERFKPEQIAEFATEVLVDWLVRNVLPRRGLGVIYGSSTAGKTFWTLDIIFAVARGLSDWRGLQVTQGDVVYIAAEGVDGVRKRVRAYGKHHRVPLADLPFRVIKDTPNLMKDDHKELAQKIGTADVIVVDTLAAVMPGADENSAKDVGQVLKRCKEIQEATGALVILIHHSGKNEGAGARGWSGIRAAVDVEICITRNNDDRTAEITKLKDGEGEGRKFPFRLQVVDLGRDNYGDQVTSCVVEHLDTAPATTLKRPTGKDQRIVFEVIESHGPMTSDEVLRLSAEKKVHDPMAKRDRRRDQVRAALDSLISGNYVWYGDGIVGIYGAGVPLADFPGGGGNDDGL